MSQGNIDLGFFHETEVIGGGVRAGVERLLRSSDSGTDPTSRRRRSLLPRGAAVLFGGALPLRTERRQLPAGDGAAAVACRGVLYRPRRRLGHRGRHRGHQGRADGGLRLQCRPGRARKERARGGDRGGTGKRLVRRHERPFPPKTQVLVEVWAHM